MSAPLRRRLRAVPPRGVLGVCAPAGPVNVERLESGLTGLSERGFELRLAPHLFERHGYLAGEDALRLRDLCTLWADPEVDAILCARGGYGVMRLLPQLDRARLERTPKALVGFSDITALHGLLARKGIVSFHGPMVEAPAGGIPPGDMDALERALTHTEPLGVIAWPSDGPQPVCLTPGRCEGPLVGGNLSLLAAMSGTPWALRAAGCLLLLEDVGERPYALDRYMTQLRLAGLLDAAAGFLVGELVDCGGRPEEPTALAVIAERLAPFGKPCLANLPVAHGRRCLTLPLGVRVALDAEAARLEFLEAAWT